MFQIGDVVQFEEYSKKWKGIIIHVVEGQSVYVLTERTNLGQEIHVIFPENAKFLGQAKLTGNQPEELYLTCKSYDKETGFSFLGEFTISNPYLMNFNEEVLNGPKFFFDIWEEVSLCATSKFAEEICELAKISNGNSKINGNRSISVSTVDIPEKDLRKILPNDTYAKYFRGNLLKSTIVGRNFKNGQKTYSVETTLKW